MSYDEPSSFDDQPTTTGTATSRTNLRRRATRKATRARLAISGPTNSGKTWTALSIAEVLAPGGQHIMIDTEPSDDKNTAGELYSDRFAFDLIPWVAPYDPRDLTLTISELADDQIDVLIIDSASHFWTGEGGTLDIADGRFGGWRVATPVQNALVDAILHAPFHVIVCTRAKMEYAVETTPGGKQTVRKLGMAPIQRQDLEYEFQVVAVMDTDHRIDISKTRAAPLAGESFPANQQDRFATIYRDWLALGLQLVTQADADLIRQAINTLEEVEERNTARRTFREQHGNVDELEVAELPAAWSTVSAVTGVDPHPFTPREDEPHVCGTCTLGRRAGWHNANLPQAAPPQAATQATQAATAPPEHTPVTTATEAAPEPQAATQRPEPAEAPAAAPAAVYADDDPERPFTEGGAVHVPDDPDGLVLQNAAATPTQEEAQGALDDAHRLLERRHKYEEHVKKLPITAVRTQLEGARLDSQGPAPKVRERLVEHLMAQAANADAARQAS